MEALERFVADNDDLLELEDHVARFNIFEALGIARAEIKHSNFLAWLLDPAESHAQGDLFLKAILMDLLRQAPASERRVSPVEIDGAELSDVDIRREWKHIDLLIHCRSPGFVIAIENKMHGFERAEKLGRYEEAVRREYPGIPSFFVFLNPDGGDAPDEDWFAYSYARVHGVLQRVQRTMKGSLGTDVGVILEHYLRLLETRLMDDAKIAELCRRIYRNHKQAIDLINEHGAVEGRGVLGALQRRLQELKGWRVVNNGSSYARFMPDDWAKALPPLGSPDDGDPQQWLTFRVAPDQSSLTLRVRTRNVADRTARNQFLDRLFSLGGSLGVKPKFKTWRDQERLELWSEKVTTWDEADEPDVDQIFDSMMKRARPLAEALLSLLKQAAES
jgi:hypothetical protein